MIDVNIIDGINKIISASKMKKIILKKKESSTKWKTIK